MSAMRLAMMCLWLLPAIALGQPEEDQADKVSNDQPGRPLQMPPASSEVKEALDDFDRFRRRNAWERALKALYAIPTEQAARFVDGDDGFIITIANRRRALLAALPAEGQAAYRLFYDSEAKKLYDEAEGSSDPAKFERIYSAYFPTTVGDNAADRLGDLYFELGRFDRAADCWLAILRDCPDTDLAPSLITTKAALALVRAGRTSEYEQIRGDLAGRYAADPVTLGGKSGPPAEVLAQILGNDGPSGGGAKEGDAPDPAGASPDLASRGDAAWKVRFGDSITAGMTPAELLQWESNSLSAVVPAAAVSGTTLFANYLGHDFAVDLESGKMLWRSASFHHVDLAAMQQNARMIDPKRYAIIASGEYAWSLGRDLKDQNYAAPFRLTCRRADTGDVAWKSADLPDYAEFDLAGPPLLAGGKLFIPAKSGQNQSQQKPPGAYVLAIQPRDGKVLWKAEIGTLRQGSRYYYYGPSAAEPQPRLAYRGGMLYVDTQIGVLARLNADSGELDWGYGYRTDAAGGQERFIFFGDYQAPEPAGDDGHPLFAGDALLAKGAKSDRLFALDPDRMKLLWDRPIAKSARVLGSVGESLLLGGPELGGLDLRSRKLLWSARLPDGSASDGQLVRPDGLWQLTPRGIFELDPQTGDVRRIFRGDDTGSVGGRLFLTDRLLLAVSNRAISAYDRRAPAEGGPDATKKGETDE